MAIVFTEVKAMIAGHTGDVVDRLRVAFKTAKNHWLAPKEEVAL